MIICLCGDIELIGGIYEKIVFIVLLVLMFFCGLFLVEDVYGFGVFSGEMIVIYGNEDGFRIYLYLVRFMLRG